MMNNKKSNNLDQEQKTINNTINKFYESNIIQFLKDFNEGKIKDDEDGVGRFMSLAESVYALNPITDITGKNKVLQLDRMTEQEQKEHEGANAFYDSLFRHVRINKDYIVKIIKKEGPSISDFFNTLFHEREHAIQQVIVDKYKDDISKGEVEQDDYLDKLSRDRNRKNVTQEEYQEIEKIIASFVGGDKARKLINSNDPKLIQRVCANLKTYDYLFKVSEKGARQAGWINTSLFLRKLQQNEDVDEKLKAFIDEQLKLNDENYEQSQKLDDDYKSITSIFTKEIRRASLEDYVIYNQASAGNIQLFSALQNENKIFAEEFILKQILSNQSTEELVNNIQLYIGLNDYAIVNACVDELKNRGKISQEDLESLRSGVKLQLTLFNKELSDVYSVNYSSILTGQDIIDIGQKLINDENFIQLYGFLLLNANVLDNKQNKLLTKMVLEKTKEYIEKMKKTDPNIVPGTPETLDEILKQCINIQESKLKKKKLGNIENGYASAIERFNKKQQESTKTENNIEDGMQL